MDSVAYPAYWIARQQAVANGRPRRAMPSFLRQVGPGIVTGAADDEPVDIKAVFARIWEVLS